MQGPMLGAAAVAGARVGCPLEGVRTSRALWWLRGRFAPAEADAVAGRLRVSL